MILYDVVSSYHLLNALVRSCKDEGWKVLVCSKWLAEKISDMNALLAFFDKVEVADSNYRFQKHTTPETRAYYESLVGSLNSFDEIYVWAAHYSMGVLLSEINIPFIFCEDAAGLLSRPNVIKRIEANHFPSHEYKEYKDSLGLYDGQSSLIKNKLCNVKAQSNTFLDNANIIDFDIVTELANLPAEKRKSIQRVFDADIEIDIPDKAALLLTENLVLLNQASFENQILAYQLIIDFFFPTYSLVIKPHPDDLIYYKRLFPEAEVVRSRFPVEFAPFVFSGKPSCIATVSSTSIFNLQGHYDHIFELNKDFLDDVEVIYKYYCAIDFAKKLDLPIVCFGANEQLVLELEELLCIKHTNRHTSNCELRDGCVLLVDDVTNLGEDGRKLVRETLELLDDSSCAVLINSKHDFCWYTYECRYFWDSITPIVLKKQSRNSRREDFYASLDDEIMYVYSKNERIVKMLNKDTLNIDLNHTGITLEKKTLNAYEERIKMLEGILAATEQRLLYYIEKEKTK